MTQDDMMGNDPDTYRQQMARIEYLENENAALKVQLQELRSRHAELEEVLKEHIERIDPSLANIE